MMRACDLMGTGLSDNVGISGTTTSGAVTVTVNGWRTVVTAGMVVTPVTVVPGRVTVWAGTVTNCVGPAVAHPPKARAATRRQALARASFLMNFLLSMIYFFI
jgi:hypothetical protein